MVYLTAEQLAALDYRIIGTAQNCITITHASADTNVAGASHTCKRAIIKAHPANTGLAWVDFGTAAVDLACYPLNKDESVSVPVNNTDQINCLFKVGGEKVTVTYTN